MDPSLADAKKKKEAEEQWKAKQVELAKQKAQELGSKANSTPRAEDRPAVVSSAPLNPLEELERIRKEAQANGSDSYFGTPKV